MRIKLHPGVWVGFLSLFFGGTFAALSAAPTQHKLWVAGWVSIAAGLALAIWGVTYNGQHWWRTLRWPRFPRFLRGQMYVGQILAFDSQLDQLHTLSLTVRGYNGTGRDRIFLGASGQIKLSYSMNGTGPNGTDLAPPGLVDPPMIIPANSEFNINFQQPLTPHEARSFRQWEANGADITMMFGGLIITTKPRVGRPERILLWDGISLRNGRFFGRIVCATCTATAHASASLVRPQQGA